MFMTRFYVEPAASLDVILLGDFNMRPDVESK